VSLLVNFYQYKNLRPTPFPLDRPLLVENKQEVGIGEKQELSSVCLPTTATSLGTEAKTYQLLLLECEERVNLKDKERQKYLPLEDRFKEGKQSPQLETVLLHSLKSLLLNEEKQRLEAKVECRGNVCQIELIREEGQEFKTVIDKIQSDETILAMLRDFKTYRGMPVLENGSQIVHWKHRLLFEMEP
jgi:hypothetical protein